MPSPTILLLEDELALARLIREALERSGYVVRHCADGHQGLQAARRHPPNLLLVDVMLPGLDGFAVVRALRPVLAELPILFLTARAATADVVRGFEAGGNDYLKKPFSLEELLLRVRELLRRTPAGPANPETVALGRYEFRPPRQELWLDGSCTARLSARENDLLLLLVQHRHGVLDRRATLRRLWGDDNFFTARSMDVYVSRLRKHLRHDDTLAILNIRGVGFKLIS